MQVEHNELLDAINDVLKQQATPDGPEGVTTRELCASKGYSEGRTRQLIDDGIRNGIIKHVRVWRETNAGYRTRVNAWQLNN